MWPDMQKGVFHTHPIYQVWAFIIFDWKEALTWNLVNSECQHRVTIMQKFSGLYVCWKWSYGLLSSCNWMSVEDPFSQIQSHILNMFKNDTGNLFGDVGYDYARSRVLCAIIYSTNIFCRYVSYWEYWSLCLHLNVPTYSNLGVQYAT